ncbi:MAG: glycosyltransferase family protein [Candidatus Riflebacteria bacterium]|nr:glycosyltransferase family protein [Candidatus Riflebacteria bacterium]
MKTVKNQIVIQARMGSSRLPGKTLMDLAGRPVIDHVINRCRAALSVERVVLAVPDLPADDQLEQWCNANDVLCVRGSSDDVLSRYIKAIDTYPCQTLVRITADCPLVDPAMIDAVLALHEAMGNDYTSNVGPPNFPKGYDVEVVNADVLRRVDAIAVLDQHREHVTSYIRMIPDEFKTYGLSYGLNMPEIRLTLDKQEDYQALQKIFELCVRQNPLCSMYQVLAFLNGHPEILAINSAGVPFDLPPGFLKSR